MAVVIDAFCESVTYYISQVEYPQPWMRFFIFFGAFLHTSRKYYSQNHRTFRPDATVKSQGLVSVDLPRTFLSGFSFDWCLYGASFHLRFLVIFHADKTCSSHLGVTLKMLGKNLFVLFLMRFSGALSFRSWTDVLEQTSEVLLKIGLSNSRLTIG